MSIYSSNTINLSGVPEGFDAHVLTKYISKNDTSIAYIARDDKRLEALRSALWFFDSTLPVFSFPAWDCLPYDRVSPNSEVAAARMATLAALSSGFDKPFIILTTLAAITQYVPKRNIVCDNSFIATVGRTVSDKKLRSYFTRMGFVQTPTVTEPGDYAIRGGIIDVFPPGEAGPVRMDMFGDELE
ncbi:MAG: transcription-repair coupling factor, partial [Rhodobacterales bacterium]